MKTLLITGATDGIGKLTAQKLHAAGHTVLIHGRNPAKLAAFGDELGVGEDARLVADFSRLADVERMAAEVAARVDRVDALINNAGVFKTSRPTTAEGLDVRFVVNLFAPYVLTHRLLPLIPREGRVVNLSSAAQAPVDVAALRGERRADDMGAYAQSKLAITLWSSVLAESLPDGPTVVAVNPGSLLASKMVKEGFGVPGKDLSIGADILIRAALDPEFEGRSGAYWDNDAGMFRAPNPAALDPEHRTSVMKALAETVERLQAT